MNEASNELQKLFNSGQMENDNKQQPQRPSQQKHSSNMDISPTSSLRRNNNTSNNGPNLSPPHHSPPSQNDRSPQPTPEMRASNPVVQNSAFQLDSTSSTSQSLLQRLKKIRTITFSKNNNTNNNANNIKKPMNNTNNNNNSQPQQPQQSTLVRVKPTPTSTTPKNIPGSEENSNDEESFESKRTRSRSAPEKKQPILGTSF
jgi:hypothetical protein